MNISAKSSAVRANAILTERARRLAERPQALHAAETRRVCLCEAGGDLYGIPVEDVARVMSEAHTAPLAEAEPALLGVMSRGGGFALVYDLSALIGAVAAPQTGEGHFVLLRSLRPLTALKVSRVDAITDIELLSAEDTVNLPVRASIAAYGRAGDGRIVSIIDIAALMHASARNVSGG